MSEQASAGSWRSLVQSLASFRGDLSSLTAPPFILAPASLLEYSRYWYPGHEQFVYPATMPTEQERFVEVVRMFMHIMKGQFTQRNISEGFEKKPLNPFLGELFVATLDNEGDILRAEQVSHHPPVYAYQLSAADKDSTVEQEGYVGIRARFTTSVYVEQEGHTIYRLLKHNEEYIVGLPNLHLEGFITFAPYIELDGGSTIKSSTGYTASMAYSGAGYFRGKKHTLSAEIKNPQGEVLYTVQGQWDTKLTITDVATNKTEVFVSHEAEAPVPKMDVTPVEEQHELESRRAWKEVAEAIKSNDTDGVWQHKSALEQAQRDQRKREQEEGVSWKSRWFTQWEGNELVGAGPHWKFSKELYANDADFKHR